MVEIKKGVKVLYYCLARGSEKTAKYIRSGFHSSCWPFC